MGSEPLLPIGQYVADASQAQSDDVVKEASANLSEVTPLTTTEPLKEDEVEVPEEWHSSEMPVQPAAAQPEGRLSFHEAPQPVIKPTASYAASPRAAASPHAGSKRSDGRGSGRRDSSSHRHRREEEEQYGSDDDGLREQTYLTEQVALQQQRARTQGRRQSQQTQYEQAKRYAAPEPQRRAHPVDYTEYAQAVRPSHSPKYAAVTQPSSSSHHRSHDRENDYAPAAEQEGERFEGIVEAQRPARGRRSLDPTQVVIPSAVGERDTEGHRRVWNEGTDAPGSPTPREERRGRNRHGAPTARSEPTHAEVVAEDDDLAAEALDEDEGALSGANDRRLSDPRVNRRRRRRAQDD